jgi:hypothetical protein
MLELQPLVCCGQDHTIAKWYSLPRWGSVVDHTVVKEGFSTVNAVDDTAGMFGLQIKALDATSKQCCHSESKFELHGFVLSTDMWTLGLVVQSKVVKNKMEAKHEKMKM